MPDDLKDEEITKPQPSDGAPENLPPFVPNDNSANFVALSGRARMQLTGRGALTTNAQVFPPLLTKTVRYVDFGFTSTREYWTEVAEPAYQRFLNDEKRAAMPLLHVCCYGRSTIGYGTSSTPARTPAKARRITTSFGSSFSVIVRSLHGCEMLPMLESIAV
jgi:hypothetical protein